MKQKFQAIFSALSLTMVAMLTGLTGVHTAQAQNLFAPVIRVNDEVVTRYELEQRALLLKLFRAPGDPRELAREQLIEERLKLEAARNLGLTIDETAVDAGMEEFASRSNVQLSEFLNSLAKEGISESSYRDFVRAGITWRDLSLARFGSRLSVSEEDLERAREALSGQSTLRVLVSEMILPVREETQEQVEEIAAEAAALKSYAKFSEMAQRYSASGTAADGGRLAWMPITKLPAPLRPAILALEPGEVTAPVQLEGAVALFQMRGVQEVQAPPRRYSAIEYAVYRIAGGRSEAALARAAQVKANVSTCDDLYGIAQGEPHENLQRYSLAPDELTREIGLELAKLDPGEVSTTLTSNNGTVLNFIMMCGRAPVIAGDTEGPTPEELTAFVRERRLTSMANGWLEQLRAEARIIELQ